MERIQGLKEYVQTEHYLEGIGIGKEEQKEIQITYQPLAQGEYNINYWFVHPLTGKKLVLRVNTGSRCIWKIRLNTNIMHWSFWQIQDGRQCRFL